MLAVFKRELKSYFASPIGYVCIAALIAIYGFFYFQVMLTGSSSYIASLYDTVYMFNMMIIPIITMRSMCEDRKNKTDQILLTAPVNVSAIVCGKFLSCFAIFFIASTLGGILPALAMATFSNPPWGILFGNYIATLLYGGAVISIGVFISSLTVSQIISAIATFVVSMLLMYLDSMASALGSLDYVGAFLAKIINAISFTDRYDVFTTGIFSIQNAVFFLSVIAFFVFLTARRLESRRWN